MTTNKVEICIEICRKDAIIPKYANPGDAGMDVYAAEQAIIKPGQTAVIPTGIKLAIPESYEIQVRPRSGISLKTPLRIANSPGTIDSGYRDELGIIISNTSPETGESAEMTKSTYYLSDSGNKKGTYMIRKGDRIAQLVLMPVPRMSFKVVPSVSDIGTDRGGGFGSTGVK